jgi:hypothetical protein
MKTPTFGDKWGQFEKLYEGLNSNKKYEMTLYYYPQNDHPKTIGKLFIASSKKWIRI